MWGSSGRTLPPTVLGQGVIFVDWGRSAQDKVVVCRPEVATLQRILRTLLTSSLLQNELDTEGSIAREMATATTRVLELLEETEESVCVRSRNSVLRAVACQRSVAVHRRNWNVSLEHLNFPFCCERRVPSARSCDSRTRGEPWQIDP